MTHDHKRPDDVQDYDSKDLHRSAKIVDATTGYGNQQSEQKYILMINEAIYYPPCSVIQMVQILVKFHQVFN